MNVMSNEAALLSSGAWKFAKDMVDGDVGYVVPWNVAHENGNYYISPFSLVDRHAGGTCANKVARVDGKYHVDITNATQGIEINFSTPEKDKSKYIPCAPIENVNLGM